MLQFLLDVFMFFGTFIEPGGNVTEVVSPNASMVFRRNTRHLSLMSSTLRKGINGGIDPLDASAYEMKGNSATLMFNEEIRPTQLATDNQVLPPPPLAKIDDLLVFIKLTIELGLKVITGKELSAEETSLYFNLMPQHFLNMFTDTNATSSCSKDSVYNVLDVSARTARVLTNIISFLEGTSEEEVGEAQELADMTADILFNSVHKICKYDDTGDFYGHSIVLKAVIYLVPKNETIQDIRVAFLLNLLQNSCHYKTDLNDAQQPEASIPSENDFTYKFNAEVERISYNLYSNGTFAHLTVTQPTTTEIEEAVYRVITDGGAYYFWLLKYITNEIEDKSFKSTAMSHHMLYYQNFLKLSQLVVERVKPSEKEIVKEKMLKPLLSIYQVIIQLIHFIDVPSPEQNLKATAAFQKLGKDIYELVKFLMANKNKTTIKPITANNYSLKDADAPIIQNIQKLINSFIVEKFISKVAA